MKSLNIELIVTIMALVDKTKKIQKQSIFFFYQKKHKYLFFNSIQDNY